MKYGISSTNNKNLCYLSTKNRDTNIYNREIETNSGIVVDDRKVIVYG